MYRCIYVYVSVHIECIFWAHFYKLLSLREAHSELGAASFQRDSSWAVVEVLQSLWGILLELVSDLLLELFSALLTTCLQKVFPFSSNSQAKCHSQPLPQCLPSLKQNNRWPDPDVPYLAHFAVVSCFLIMLGYELEVIPAALAASLLTKIKTAWFSHYYLLRQLLRVHLLRL